MANSVIVNPPIPTNQLLKLSAGTLFRYYGSSDNNVYMKTEDSRIVSLKSGKVFIPSDTTVDVLRSVTITTES